MAGSSGHLVATLLLLVQPLLLWLIQVQFRPYSGGLRGAAAFHTVALYEVLCVVFLADGDGPFLTVASDVNGEDSRHVAHVNHLEPVHHILLELLEQSLDDTEEHTVVHVERQDDETGLVLVGVFARIRHERAEADGGELYVRCAEPVLWALPETVQAFLEFYDERNSYFVVDLVAGRYLDEHVLLVVDVEEYRLHAQHIVVQLHSNYEYHAGVLKPAQGSESATAVDARIYKDPARLVDFCR